MAAGDEQLMLAYRGGDAGAFEQLYARHKGGLYRFVLRSIRDRATAEELYQEVWMRVIEARERYEERAKFTTWLYTIAHNRLVDHWRKRGLQLVSLDGEEGAAPEPAADAGYEPQRIAEARQGVARFARALEALPAAQREAFLLHQEAEMSVAEIAQATGCGEEAAKSRLRYATAKLKEALGDD
ncbi:MAG TPA: RNA polymerase sigma factor [Burkholderiales bacterium]|jgi:RNA polymerase sigma-70 factor (ECF subfamily)